MKNLTVYTVDAIDHLVQPDEFDDVTPESSALTILTDFKEHRPHVVEAHITAVEAADLMHQENIKFKLVVDRHNEFVGLISIEDLSDQSILLTQVANGAGRDEVLVADLMHHRESIRAINYDEFKRSSVADIIYTLQRHGQQYYIVVDRDQHHIRGVVSSTEISRRLHTPVYVERQPSVADILSLVRG
ncbi:CBS domain-containing protein [Cellvibrio sp. PSBB006]|uniref:CBS domain-containing protein n=1 Tax=Cellvibrio sp. PSBB006 TaxID=1987723 RepID=UPI000B3B2A84|nr:CBS domain-containing protein [Cellvibrio sp. PSBB006]ARU29568.1 CBS domain-containing protein [Cellvibrio sp. PSBB006]